MADNRRTPFFLFTNGIRTVRRDYAYWDDSGSNLRYIQRLARKTTTFSAAIVRSVDNETV